MPPSEAAMSTAGRLILPDIAGKGVAETSDMRSMADTIGSGVARAFGPPPEARIKKETARAAALQAGFEYDREFSSGSHHYGLLFKKSL